MSHGCKTSDILSYGRGTKWAGYSHNHTLWWQGNCRAYLIAPWDYLRAKFSWVLMYKLYEPGEGEEDIQACGVIAQKLQQSFPICITIQVLALLHNYWSVKSERSCSQKMEWWGPPCVYTEVISHNKFKKSSKCIISQGKSNKHTISIKK